ncbi:ribonucleoside-diphosphate reductase subunit alpha [Dyella sp. LX-66]|uniref:ribonucleoside-diphosphate reductase subunit alpha n=1 Tax=unclassified Dyella TaxID=2634549 RepID=UPI001BE11D90|nr:MULTISPECIES: ribonucleoside-diphosphate reductase subunit alpha [unclassified Dyella]MBT2116506.1 ribonucleoside-diphosphate reductase subunit alpha [Dyella sp. LX-1]MBT2140551.1 ribonucleoside-diphosphate reductase subunit alpha [Dyella sp. LX-66]
MQPIDTDSRERTDDRADASAFPAADAAAAAPEPVRMEAVAETPFALTPPHNPGQMRVTKRNGSQEIVDVNKIVRAVTRSGEGLHAVDPLRVALKTIGGLYDGATTRELDELSIRTAAALTAEEPEYGQLAARLLGAYVDKEVSGQEIQSFSQSIARGAELGILNARLRDFVAANARKLNDAIDPLATRRFEYFGLRTVYDRYLLRHPQLRKVIETPQYFFMRIACALGGSEIGETLELYRLLSSLEYMASSPTLFNAGTAHEQLSSCFLLDSPTDSLESIYEKYGDVAKLSKFAGGIGLAYSRVRSRGSLIRGTNGHSNGLVPWLKTLDASVAAVNQGGKRKGAACVYLEPWHADIEEFLELRDNTGDEARRTHNLNLANWIPDEFMRRVESDGDWSLFDPKIVPHFVDSWGETFERAYREAEAAGIAVKKVKARELYARMLRTLAQTGNGWMTFKDRSNATSNQTAKAENVIHLSNLCTEILEVTNAGETAVCNLGSVNLARHVVDGVFDFDKLAATVRTAVRQLDRVIDLNFYPIDTARTANQKWRPVGLGVMGLQDVFFKLRLPFDSADALALSTRIAEEIYFHALTMSNELAREHGAHPGFAESRAANGELQFDYWPQARPNDAPRWESLRASVQEHGLRNSLLIAIAPTATIASISGCYECIEPQVSNLFKRETLSGDFLVVNRYLVEELKTLGLWTPEVRDAIKLAEGSIQGIANIPERLRQIYRTVWELPQKALIDLGAARGAYIDQSQSLNLFMENPNIGQLSSMYMYAWKSGIKTTYYLRSRPATKIAKTTVSATAPAAKPAPEAEQEQANAAVFCSLENPEYCEACQ